MSIRNFILRIGKHVPVLRDFINRYMIIGRFANAAPARPRPFSMAQGYTSWPGLTDRRWSGRHLPEIDTETFGKLPAEDKVVDLFRRREFIPSDHSSIMFMFFAQWFTDSFLRTDFTDPRRNSSNHEIDLCQIYGLTEEKTHMLRAHEGGRLASQMIDGQEFPEFLFEEIDGTLQVRDKFKGKDGAPDLHPPAVLDHVLGPVPEERKRFVFAVGLEHGNATVGYAVLNTLFLREHNRIAGLIAADNPGWDDEQIFQTTRSVLTVILLKIVIEDYIAHISPVDFPIKTVIGAADRARWGKTNWISIEFNLLYRWHSLVPDTLKLGGQDADKDTFLNNNAYAIERGIGPLISDFSAQHAGKIGLHNNPYFMFIEENGNKSTTARTIAISRAAKLKPYNAYRQHFGMWPLRSFDELTDDKALAAELEALYGHIDRLEWFVGLFAEGYGKASIMGQLQATMVAHDAFTQALTNPLLCKRVYGKDTFSAVGLKIVEETSTLRQLVERNVTGEADCSFEI